MTRLWQRFITPSGDAELPDLDRLLARGVRATALVYALFLLPLSLALALRAGVSPASVFALQLVTQAAIWACFAASRTDTGRRRAEVLLCA